MSLSIKMFVLPPHILRTATITWDDDDTGHAKSTEGLFMGNSYTIYKPKKALKMAINNFCIHLVTKADYSKHYNADSPLIKIGRPAFESLKQAYLPFSNDQMSSIIDFISVQVPTLLSTAIKNTIIREVKLCKNFAYYFFQML